MTSPTLKLHIKYDENYIPSRAISYPGAVLPTAKTTKDMLPIK